MLLHDAIHYMLKHIDVYLLKVSYTQQFLGKYFLDIYELKLLKQGIEEVVCEKSRYYIKYKLKSDFNFYNRNATGVYVFMLANYYGICPNWYITIGKAISHIYVISKQDLCTNFSIECCHKTTSITRMTREWNRFKMRKFIFPHS